MNKKFLSALLAVFFICSMMSAQEKYAAVPEQFKMIDKDNSLNSEEALLQKFYFIFDKQKLKTKYNVNSMLHPFKCATGLMEEYHRSKSLLSSDAVKTIEGYLNRPFNKTADTKTYISPAGKFELTYSTEGADAVFPADSNGNSVPDFVEWVADYFDYSWDFTIDSLGYLPPPIGEGRYQIGFENMDFYGYTEIVSGKLTRIVMHSNFLDFPENTDPEGNQKGAAKATAIHEFKHAVQRVYNDWEEDGWFSEMDATWMEDIGYDYVNDYYNYLTESQLRQPYRSFNQGSGYEDCLWLHYITEKYGLDANRMIWERLLTIGNEPIYNTFNEVLSSFSSSFKSGFAEYYSWNFSTGERADGLFETYEEATEYPASILCGGKKSIPSVNEGCGLNPPSGNFLCFNGNDLNKFLKIKFNGDAGGDYTIKILVAYKNGTTDQLTFDLSPSTNLDYLLKQKIKDINYLAVIPVLTNFSGSSKKYIAELSIFQTAEFVFAPLRDTESLEARTISIQLINENNIAVTDSLKLFYRINNAQFISQPMLPDGEEFSSDIPPVSSNSIVEYYFSIYDTLGDYTYYPDSAPAETFSYFAGPDNQLPTLNHFSKSILNKHNFPLTIYVSSSDNIGIDSLFVEYKINDGELLKSSFELIKDSIYSGKINIDAAQLNTGDKFEYRITAVDLSENHNKKYFPEEGFSAFILADGYSYSSSPQKEIKIFPVMRDTIEVTDDFIIKDLNIKLKFRHNRISDLTLRIIPPFRPATPLFTRPGLGTEFGNANDPDIIIDQEAFETFENFEPYLSNPLIGEFRPDTTNLNYFNGYNAKGKWIITINDYVADESGIMDEWKLIFSGDKTTDIAEENLLPLEFSLEQNYPNPFNPETIIKFNIAQQTFGSLKIYDITGSEVAVLVNGELLPGSYQLVFDASKNNLASGFYFYRLQTNQFNSTRKMLFLK